MESTTISTILKWSSSACPGDSPGEAIFDSILIISNCRILYTIVYDYELNDDEHYTDDDDEEDEKQ